ncbi:precorrin-3B synthase [Sinosporangium album]|uniref:Precorrin-3B synthase n=2 Tax=Sinosporangium album TaxID=504805 RepID=A0A1G8JFS3_9ACTN|nr:precorrin-3B synthase [Sinosporangium album]
MTAIGDPGRTPAPGGRARADACPGALHVHQAADGGLARIRVPGGHVTAPQLRLLAAFAPVELTSRANIQMRGLASGAELPLAARLADAGLLPSRTHERVRNIVASPFSGLDDQSLLDVAPLATALDAALCAAPALAALPGRFLFALDDGRGDATALDADVTAVPLGGGTPDRTAKAGPPQVALLLAGVDTGLRVPAAHAVAAMLAAASAFLDEVAADGTRAWRIAELPDGPRRVTARLLTAPHRATSLYGTAPSTSAPATGPLPMAPASADPDGGPLPVPPSPVPRSAVPPGPVPRSAVPPGPVPPGPVAQLDGRVALALAVPLGRLTSAQLDLLAEASEATGRAVRLTPWRGVVVPGLAAADLDAWTERLAAAGLVADPASPWVGVTACTGRPGCAKSLADVQADAAAAVDASAVDASAVGLGAARPAEAGTLPVHRAPVHWAGCARRCGRPKGRVVDVVATGNGYRVDFGNVGVNCADLQETVAATAAVRGER